MATLKAYGDNIFVKPHEAEKMVGSIHIPSEFTERPCVGIVTTVGPKAASYASEGDTIYYGQHAGNDTSFDGVDLVVIKPSDVLGVTRKGV